MNGKEGQHVSQAAAMWRLKSQWTILPVGLTYSLRHVHWNEKRKGANSPPSHKPSHHDLIPMVCGGNHGDISHAKDHVPEDDGIAATNEIRHWTAYQSSEKCADGEHSDNQSGSNVAEIVGAVTS